MLVYEQMLAGDPNWALFEGSMHFEEKSAVQNALRKITQRLDGLGIPYAVCGGMALFAHGYRRFTEDVDILVTHESLKKIHQELEGLGYVPPFDRSKNLRDTELGVRIEFLLTGQYPGDGKPKPVAFADPQSVAEDLDGINYVNLHTLIELKLASGMTSPERMKDLADVQELIKLLCLPQDFEQKLNPYVQSKFQELWAVCMQTPKKYMMIWRNKYLTSNTNSLDEMISALQKISAPQEAIAELEAMNADGVVLDLSVATSGDHAYLITTDPAIAKKYDMHDEAEFWQQDENETGKECDQ